MSAVLQTLAAPVLFTGEQPHESGCWPIAGGTAAVTTTVSPARDTPNEDSAALFPIGPDRGVLVVADGVGGERAGRQASNTAVACLAETLAVAADTGQPLRSAVLDGMERANEAVLGLGVGAATTLAVVLLEEGTARPFHVGDSTILLMGQRGRIKLQTIAHSPVGFAVESGLLDEEAALHHEDRHVVSNLVGSPEMRIELGPVLELAQRDTLLLASDGLSDNLGVDDIVEGLRKGPLSVATRRLAAAARDRMIAPVDGQPSKPDDLSLIAFRPMPMTLPR